MAARVPSWKPPGHAQARKAQITAYEGSEERMADKRFYASTRWRKFRAYMLSLFPLCVDCQAENRVTASEHVHHVKPRKTHLELAFDEDNVVCLCEACHTAREKGKKGQP